MHKIITRSVVVAALALLSQSNYAQVGIGTTTPDASSALDVTSTDSGMLVPRVSLVNVTNGATPVNTPATSLLVYNTNASIVGGSGEGFYYWDGSEWVRLATKPTTDWSITGNAGTNTSTNFIGTTDAQGFVVKTNNVERYRVLATGNTGFGTTTPASSLSVAANTTIGSNYAAANAAPTDGLRVEGQAVIGKSTGEDTRDKFSVHTTETSYNNVTGYPNDTADRAIAGYAAADEIGVFGYATRTGYGVVGLAHANSISSFVQTGEGVLGQADGTSGATSIPIGVHGIIDESTSGIYAATPVLGENNNITTGFGLGGGAYNSATPAVSGVYGNFASRVTNSNTNAYQFGVIGDILLLGVANQPDASGGVLGTNASSDFGILGYKSMNGTMYCVYGGGANDSLNNGNNGRTDSNNSTPNNTIGLGINGGFMGGYVRGSQYGMISKGQEFGMYVQGNTLVNEPIVQLIDNNSANRAIAYTPASTTVDVNTRGNGALKNGKTFVRFDQTFKNLVSKTNNINITITPTGETNGVFVSKITADGFYVKENLQGTSNASFNWVAIGTRAKYEKGVAISNTILSNNFDKNMSGVMSNDGSGLEGTPIYFDGNDIKFERIPEGIIKYNKKKQPKKTK